jgi:hypothetical protein
MLIAPPPLGPDPDEGTHYARQAITSGNLFRTLAQTTEGRQELRRHRQIARARLRSETDWRELGYAAWVLREVELALAPKASRRRKPAAQRPLPKRPRRASEVETLQRVKSAADLVCSLLAVHAWESGDSKFGMATYDMRDACMSAQRASRLTGDLLKEGGR